MSRRLAERRHQRLWSVQLGAATTVSPSECAEPLISKSEGG